jgi:3D (Asp-Asp-Asp) domain-containing protein
MTKFTLSLAKKIAWLGQLALFVSLFVPHPSQAATLALDVGSQQSTLKMSQIETESLHTDGSVTIEPQPDKSLDAVITAYSSTLDQTDNDPFTAASGKQVYDGMVANNCLPFGTKLRFPDLYGKKVFTVDDRMNSRYGCHRFDIWLKASRSIVNSFGVKRVAVEIFVQKKSVELARAK